LARAASTAVEETGRVESNEVERAAGTREFWDEKRNDTGRTTIYRFKNISSGLKPEPLLILLEFGLKRALKPLLMKVLSAVV
jgi:hypothetical protein